MISDYLIQQKHVDIALQLMKPFFQNNIIKPEGWLETGYHETFQLLYSKALFGMNEKKEAAEIFQHINTKHFHFIFQKYFSIQYLNLKSSIHSALTKKEASDLNTMIAQTKFTYLK